jgi:hypothetical protein
MWMEEGFLRVETNLMHADHKLDLMWNRKLAQYQNVQRSEPNLLLNEANLSDAGIYENFNAFMMGLAILALAPFCEDDCLNNNVLLLMTLKSWANFSTSSVNIWSQSRHPDVSAQWRVFCRTTQVDKSKHGSSPQNLDPDPCSANSHFHWHQCPGTQSSFTLLSVEGFCKDCQHCYTSLFHSLQMLFQINGK